MMYPQEAMEKVIQERDAARRETEALREALKLYGVHRSVCTHYREYDPRRCDCGFNAALASLPEREPKP